jgi:hypothetical protein
VGQAHVFPFAEIIEKTAKFKISKIPQKNLTAAPVTNQAGVTTGKLAMKSQIPAPCKAVLAQKECHEYVGGRPAWEELKRAHPEILVPFRKTSQGWEYYLVEVVDRALKAAQLSGSLIHKASQ